MKPKIFVHIPAYREPELIPTIEDCIAHAKDPKNLVFGICRQFHPDDTFDNLDKYRGDKRFKIIDIPYKEAKGLPYARAKINELITKETYILQLDSHHRFAQDWDATLIRYHKGLEKFDCKPIITGYLPLYNPKTDPVGRSMEPWQQQFACFYPHGTIFIRPGLLQGWDTNKEPVHSRFVSGHFCFARTEWAKEILHDPAIYFSGEELNLTVRSYTHGYDLFHIPEVVIWHATMREERDGILIWDDQSKRGENWFLLQQKAWQRIRTLLRTEEHPEIDLTGYDLGTKRTLRDFEKYAGVHFKTKGVQPYTLQNKYPPNPVIEDEKAWLDSFARSYYHCIRFDKTFFKLKDYDFWALAFDDEFGLPVYREDIQQNQINNIMSSKDNNVGMEKFFLTDKVPKRWVIWAHSASAGWAERLEYPV
jgi:glycosyltransferase involved in cell wall biosynthesis